MKRIFTHTILLLFCIFFLSLIKVVAQAPVRKVLLEEFTTASCGNCPMMSAFIRTWHEKNAANTILMCIHEGSGEDAMSNANAAAIFNAMHPSWGWFAPAIMIDRGVYPQVDSEAYLKCYKSWGSAESPGTDSIATRLMNEPAKVGLDITGTYNPGTRVINSTVSVKFEQSVAEGDWRINLFLVEDSVVGYPNLGCFSGWDQHCYDPGWANTNYPGMFDGTSIIGYPHRHVMRNSLLGNWGAAGVIPSIPVVGETYTTNATIKVDTAYHDNHLTLVAFVSSYGANKNEKFVLNANDIKVTNDFTTDVNSAIPDNKNYSFSIENIYPNPASNNITISISGISRNQSISIYNAIGIEIKRFDYKGLYGHSFIGFSTEELPAGYYYCTLNNNNVNKPARSFVVIK